MRRFARQSAPRSSSRSFPSRAERAQREGVQRDRIRSAFTLVEMLVVVAIIAVVVSLALPSVSSLWANRKISDAVGRIEGMLMSARSRAVASSEGEQGILAFVDDKGVQRIVPITQAKVPQNLPCTSPPLANPTDVLICRDAYTLAYLDVFTVQAGRQVTVPSPLRVVPRYVIQRDATSPEGQTLTFSDGELVRKNWGDALPAGFNQAQRHRNFFAMVFSSDGQLLDRRDVLIQDLDDDGDGRGDLTGLPSSYDRTGMKALVTKYHRKDDASPPQQPKSLNQTGNTAFVVALPYLVVEATGAGASSAQLDTAINFPAVDGMLLYDDAEFRTYPDGDAATAREFLIKSSTPLYVSRTTGAIIRGPLGEGVAVQ